MTDIITPADKLACAEREVKLRQHVYERWVADGRMSAGKAAHEIACMERLSGNGRKGSAPVNMHAPFSASVEAVRHTDAAGAAISFRVAGSRISVMAELDRIAALCSDRAWLRIMGPFRWGKVAIAGDRRVLAVQHARGKVMNRGKGENE